MGIINSSWAIFNGYGSHTGGEFIERNGPWLQQPCHHRREWIQSTRPFGFNKNIGEVVVFRSAKLSWSWDILTNYTWLVVGPPLWKIWKSIGMTIPNIWENNKCSKPPTRYTIPLSKWTLTWQAAKPRLTQRKTWQRTSRLRIWYQGRHPNRFV